MLIYRKSIFAFFNYTLEVAALIIANFNIASEAKR